MALWKKWPPSRRKCCTLVHVVQCDWCESLQSRDFLLLASISLSRNYTCTLARLQAEEASFPTVQAVVFFEAPKNPLFLWQTLCHNYCSLTPLSTEPFQAHAKLGWVTLIEWAFARNFQKTQCSPVWRGAKGQTFSEQSILKGLYKPCWHFSRQPWASTLALHTSLYESPTCHV